LKFKNIENIINIDDFEVGSVYYMIAEKIGVGNALEIAELFQGSSIYFPKLDNVYAKKLREKILKEFNGYNYKHLAVKYGYSEMWIRKIVNKDILEGQISFDDIQKDA